MTQRIVGRDITAVGGYNNPHIPYRTMGSINSILTKELRRIEPTGGIGDGFKVYRIPEVSLLQGNIQINGWTQEELNERHYGSINAGVHLKTWISEPYFRIDLTFMGHEKVYAPSKDGAESPLIQEIMSVLTDNGLTIKDKYTYAI